MYDLIIVGGGPAGVTAAVFAMRRRLNVRLIANDVGGQTKHHLALPTVENQPVVLGIDIFESFKGEMEQMDFSPQIATVERVCRHQKGFAVYTGEETLLTESVIVATGVQHQRLNVPGEDKYLLRGLSYSALSYAPSFRGKKAVVVGDGRLALRSAADLALLADHVYLVGPVQGVLSLPLGQKMEAADNVTVLADHRVTEVLGDDYARSVSMEGPDGDLSQIEADGFFVEMTAVPNSGIVESLVDLESRGHINIDARNRTNVPGIFAAGDVANTYMEQVVVAVGDGAKAALSAYEYLLPTL